MELRHLRYFVAVAEAEHFGKAAVRLNVSQSPLSRQIAQLEEELGVALFTPVGRGVKLSPAGRTFLDGARATLSRADLAVQDARATAEGRSGTLVVGFEGGLAYTGILPKVMSQFRKRHPSVEVRLLPVESQDQAEALREGRISVGYQYVCNPRDDDPLLRSRVLFRDRLGVALPKDHPLAGNKTVRLADLKNERFLWPSRAVNPALNEAMLAALRAEGEAILIQEENDPEALLTLVASGAGITFFSESAAALVRVVATFKRVRDLDVVIFGRLVWRAPDEADPLVRTLLEFTRAARDG